MLAPRGFVTRSPTECPFWTLALHHMQRSLWVQRRTVSRKKDRQRVVLTVGRWELGGHRGTQNPELGVRGGFLEEAMPQQKCEG